MMDEKVKEKLVPSLTAHTTDILPYLPYLLQDFWALGSSPAGMLALFKKHVRTDTHTKVLDLACGKGAVSITLAKALNISVKGIDLIPEFIDYAKQKAQELGVSELGIFETGDVNDAIRMEHDYDCVIWGAVGNILGSYEETLKGLATTIKKGGYLLIDDAYVLHNHLNEPLNFHHVYLSYDEWLMVFKELDLSIIDASHEIQGDLDVQKEMNWIITRASELIEKYPAQRSLFEQYIENQKNEYADLHHALIGVTWLLQKC